MPQRLAVNHQRDCDVVGATDAVLHRADFLPGVLRQMAGVVAADKAGIGLLAQRAGEQPAVESGSLGLVDAILGAAKADSGKRSERGGDPGGVSWHSRAFIRCSSSRPNSAGPGATGCVAPENARVDSWSQPSRGTFKAPGGYYIGKRCRFAL
jgi:hypothetical protein